VINVKRHAMLDANKLCVTKVLDIVIKAASLVDGVQNATKNAQLDV